MRILTVSLLYNLRFSLSLLKNACFVLKKQSVHQGSQVPRVWPPYRLSLLRNNTWCSLICDIYCLEGLWGDCFMSLDPRFLIWRLEKVGSASCGQGYWKFKDDLWKNLPLSWCRWDFTSQLHRGPDSKPRVGLLDIWKPWCPSLEHGDYACCMMDRYEVPKDIYPVFMPSWSCKKGSNSWDPGGRWSLSAEVILCQSVYACELKHVKPSAPMQKWEEGRALQWNRCHAQR